jgi:hypothetical protein
MPTKPLLKLLDRDFAKVAAKELIDLACPLLKEVVNHGTNVFMRCQAETHDGQEDEHVPIVSSYLHVLEMTDGVEVLLSASCVSPAVPLVRSSFEAVLGMEYILERDYRRRAFAWMVGYAHGKLDFYERFDPATSKGKSFTQAIADDKVLNQINLPPEADPRSAADNMRQLLAKPQYQAAETEYQQYKKRKKRVPQWWFSLFEGPSNLRDLAISLQRGAVYEILYRQWSATAHGLDVARFLAPRDTAGEASIYSLRHAKELPQIALYAAWFMWVATRALILRFRPGERESLGRWYLRDVLPPLQKLARTEVQINVV